MDANDEPRMHTNRLIPIPTADGQPEYEGDGEELSVSVVSVSSCLGKLFGS